MNLSWETLPCSNMRLCQFMANYELRQQDYLVAYNDEKSIVAAGLLSGNLTQSHIDVVVSPLCRQQGIGKALAQRLIELANDQEIERLTSHGEFGFWRALGFERLPSNDYARLLPAAVKSLVSTWHQGIPITQFLELTISHASQQRVETSASMAKSINVHQSMFAGAIYSQAVLTGWGLIHLRAQQAGIKGAIVLASGDIKYRRSITTAPKGVVEKQLSVEMFSRLDDGEKIRIELSVDMFDGNSDIASAQFIGRYVILPND